MKEDQTLYITASGKIIDIAQINHIDKLCLIFKNGSKINLNTEELKELIKHLIKQKRLLNPEEYIISKLADKQKIEGENDTLKINPWQNPSGDPFKLDLPEPSTSPPFTYPAITGPILDDHISTSPTWNITTANISNGDEIKISSFNTNLELKK